MMPLFLSYEIRMISPAVSNMESYAFHPASHACIAFCCFFTGTYLAVIEKIFLTYIDRRQIGHHYIGSRKDTLLPSHHIRSSKRRCGRQKDLREYEPYYCQQAQRAVHASVRLIFKWCILMRYERPYTDHMRL